jgi:pilus assembly protein Flp/PilA
VISFSTKTIWRLLADAEGATAVEYAVMIALIAGTVIGAVQALANATRGSFDNSVSALP